MTRLDERHSWALSTRKRSRNMLFRTLDGQDVAARQQLLECLSICSAGAFRLTRRCTRRVEIHPSRHLVVDGRQSHPERVVHHAFVVMPGRVGSLLVARRLVLSEGSGLLVVKRRTAWCHTDDCSRQQENIIHSQHHRHGRASQFGDGLKAGSVLRSQAQERDLSSFTIKYLKHSICQVQLPSKRSTIHLEPRH
jgi:hypothetical protein